MVQHQERTETRLHNITIIVYLYPENIMRKILENLVGRITIGYEKKANLRFADNTVVNCNSHEALIELLSGLKRENKEVELLLNAKRQRFWWLIKIE